ncbi:histidine kinase [Rhabdobacter roseus]|uniref:Sensor histidine kinase YesM n=1 Tax=Rhabdobacter roseus TaxID=1655419 RepID=A0A840TW22_9BACT|nr:histidine kinase [Rhabdobacter roseus]MBB5287444.1 sensor histidine kinase YesM [Rhabdobacter roseus]
MDFLDRPLQLPLSHRRVTAKYALVHTAYWVLVTGFFLYEKRYLIYKASLSYFALCVTGRILLLIGIAYLNLHYFLPKYLMTKRYGRYFAWVLLSILGYLLVQCLFDYYLYGYVIGPMRNSNWLESVSYNFFSTLWYLALMVALKLSIDWYEQQRVLQQITVEKLQAEVNFLRSQINPHFLFNILNNLYALTLRKSDLAPEVVLKLSDMMEYMLYDSDDSRVPLEKELRYLQNYLELEKLRYGDQPDISLRINGSPNGQEIAPLLLLPLIENAFKHGISQQARQAWLHGQIDLEPDAVKVTVENNKPTTSPPSAKGGIGLANLRKRLELLYPGRHTLHTEEQPGVYKVALNISLN